MGPDQSPQLTETNRPQIIGLFLDSAFAVFPAFVQQIRVFLPETAELLGLFCV